MTNTQTTQGRLTTAHIEAYGREGYTLFKEPVLAAEKFEQLPGVSPPS